MKHIALLEPPVVTSARRPVPTRTPFVLGAALAVATLAAAIPTAFVDGLLLGPAVMQGSARGTAIVMLAVATPLLAAAMAGARGGSRRAALVWLGTVGYLVYNAVMLLLGTPFNALFLVYEAVLGLGIASLVALLTSMDVVGLAAGMRRAPARAVATWIGVVAGGNALVWLRGVVPGMADPANAAFLEDTGLTTFPTYVQDLAFWLPLAGLVAVWLWQQRVWGRVLAAALLVMWWVEAVGVAVDQWMGSHADPASAVATTAGAYLFAVLAVVELVPLGVVLRDGAGWVDRGGKTLST
ncbi:MAG: hypothetical protein ACKVZ6_10580 [Kineosporiaceae bacterium]